MSAQRVHPLLLCGLLGFVAIFITVTAKNFSYAQFGDVEIYFNSSVWHCDRILCPNETDRCHVEKYKSSADAGVLVRENICYSANNQVLAQRIANESIDPTANVRLKVDTYRSGLTSVQESYATHNSHSYSYNGIHGGDGTPNGFDIADAIDRAEVEKNLNFEFVDFAKISQDVEENIRKVNQQVEEQLQDLREQMANTFRNLFWR